MCFGYCDFTQTYDLHCAEWPFANSPAEGGKVSVFILNLSLRRAHTSMICDITTSIEVCLNHVFSRLSHLSSTNSKTLSGFWLSKRENLVLFSDL